MRAAIVVGVFALGAFGAGALVIFGGAPPPAVTCIAPDPPTTRGEVQAIRRLAAEEGWNQLVVVTNDYHARRTTLLLDQCLPADATVVQVPGDQNPIRRAGWVIHETGGLLHTWLQPECD